MSPLIQVGSIVVMLILSYVGLLAFGPARTMLLYTREEKDKWDSMVRTRLGSWLTITNLIGTLTSFATVFVFFLGNTKIFGVWIFVCPISIWLSAWATNTISRDIIKQPRISQLLASEDQTGGVIASILWNDDVKSRRVSWLVKAISLVSIFSIIWLEFSLFADIGGRLLGVSSLTNATLLVFISCISIFYFVLKFGLRGFVFSDIFQTPIIALGILALIIGCVIALTTGNRGQELDIPLGRPILDPISIFLFCAHVLFLNTFFVVVNESHWLRMWIFRDKEIGLQWKGTLMTAVVWIALIVLGFLGILLTAGAIGNDAIFYLMSSLYDVSPLFLVFFWFAAVAALFTTADAQIYSFLVVHGFNVRTGKLSQTKLKSIKPLVISIVAAVVFSLIYLIVRSLEAPFEKIIFTLMPLSLNVLPALVQARYGKAVNILPIVASIVGYSIFSVLGFFQADYTMALTLLSALVPVVISFLIFARQKIETIFAKDNSA